MGEIKQRDYMFDSFRGLLMLLIVMSHFTKMAGNEYGKMYLTGGFPEESFFGFAYIAIMGSGMQIFAFLSGYFSKNTERAHESAFSTFMRPYLIFSVLYYFVRIFFMGGAHLKLLTPPFALWFLFVLFFYRFFLKYYAKFEWLLPLSIVLYLAAGQIEELGTVMALGRMVSFFPFFLMGYYCSKERIEWFQKLRRKPAVLVLLGAVLAGITIRLMYSDLKVGWLLMKTSVDSFPRMEWWEDIAMRGLVLLMVWGWIILLVNILPSKKTFLAFIGKNTMPIYMFHLVIRYTIEFYGIYIGFTACLATAWFAVLSLIHAKRRDAKGGHPVLYGVSVAVSAVVIFMVYWSGILEPLYGMCPENIYLNYIMVYGGALICGTAFVAPFWTGLYELLVNGPAAGSKLVKWLRKV